MLAKAALFFKVLTVLSTVAAKILGADMLPGDRCIFPEILPIDHTTTWHHCISDDKSVETHKWAFRRIVQTVRYP